ncbi:MAG: tetratricopeptide repeat protein [Brevinema sp.]
MDMLTISLLFLVVIGTIVVGYYFFRLIFPQKNIELEIARLFDEGEFNKIVSLTYNRQKYNSSLSLLLYGARARVHCQQYNEALQWFEQSLLKVPSHHLDDKVFIEIEIGDIYTKLQKFDKADIHYRTAVSLKKDHEIANYKLASSQYVRQNYESCRNILRELLTKNPKLADARYLYAECLVELQLYAKAIRQYGLLARAEEKIVSYNYAKCLKVLKIYERAVAVYQKLISKNLYPEYREKMICDMAEIYVALKLYPTGLGIIEKNLPTIKSVSAKMRLNYIRANLLFQRGDKLIAIQEYKNLHSQKPSYRDLNTIITLYGDMLTYPFLNHYFTSNEALFESLVTNVVSSSAHVLKRALNYYIIKNGNNIHVFYRDIYSMPIKLQDEFKLVIQGFPDVDFLHLWSINGMEGHHSLTGSSYKFVLRTGQDFLVNIKDTVRKLGLRDASTEIGFVTGVPDAPELVPILEDNVDQLLKDKNLETMINDDILNKALEN